MRTLKTKPFIVLATFIAIAMSGCGKNKGTETNTTPGYPGYPSGQYPQGNYPGAGGNLGSANAPINGPITFQGGIYIDSANIYAGQGATAPTTGYNQGGYTQGQQMLMTGSGSDGWLSIQATFTSMNSANAGGQLQLSPLVQQHIQYQMQMSGMPYQVPVARIISINMGHYNTTLYGGTITLLINDNIQYRVYF